MHTAALSPFPRPATLSRNVCRRPDSTKREKRKADSLASRVSTGFLPGLEGPVDHPLNRQWTPEWTPKPN